MSCSLEGHCLQGDLDTGWGRGALTRRVRIQTWALEEARRRLEAEGILEDPEKK